MNLKQIIANTAEPDEGDVALERVRTAQTQADDIEAKGAALFKHLANTEAEMGRVALAGDDAKAAKLADAIKNIERQRSINAAARKAAADELQAAKLALHKLGCAGHIKTARRNTTAVIKNYEEMDGHINGLARTFVKHCELTDKIRLSLPVPVTGGMMLQPQAFLQLLQTELWRVLPVHPLTPSRYPALPGAKVPLFQADPAKVTPLAEIVREAMEHIVQRVEQGPVAPAPKPEPEHSEPAPAIATGAELQPSAPTMSAEQIMAGVAPRKLEA